MISSCKEFAAGLAALTLNLRWNNDWRAIRALEDEVRSHPMTSIGERTIYGDKDVDKMSGDVLQKYFYALVQEIPTDIEKNLDDALLTWGMAWSAGIKCPVEARGLAVVTAIERWQERSRENREMLASFSTVIVAILAGKEWEHSTHPGHVVRGGDVWRAEFCVVCPGRKTCHRPEKVMGFDGGQAA